MEAKKGLALEIYTMDGLIRIVQAFKNGERASIDLFPEKKVENE